jgi:hypothetical protein
MMMLLYIIITSFDCVLFTECESGKWGKNCKHECGKCDRSTCDHVNGVCQHGCAPGFIEPRCYEGYMFFYQLFPIYNNINLFGFRVATTNSQSDIQNTLFLL